MRVTLNHWVVGSIPIRCMLRIKDLQKLRSSSKKWFAISLPLLRSKKRRIRRFACSQILPHCFFRS
jgi:hypothetical protein